MNEPCPCHRLSLSRVAAVLLLLILSTYLLSPSTAFGEHPEEISNPNPAPIQAIVSPNFIETHLAPGQSTIKHVQLQYISGPDTTVTVSRHFQYTDESGSRRLIGIDGLPSLPESSTSAGIGKVSADAARWNGASWVSVDSERPSVRAGDRLDVAVRVTAPTYAEPGEHRAYLMLALEPDSHGGTVGISPSFGVRVFISVAGNEVRRVGDLKCEAEPQGILPLGSPTRLVATVANTGTVSLWSDGEVVIDRLIGGEVARLRLPEERLEPGNRSRVAVSWSGPAGWELFGLYYSRFEFRDETLAVAAPVYQTFWAVNWTGIATTIGIVLGLWLLKPARILRASFRAAKAAAQTFLNSMREK